MMGQQHWKQAIQSYDDRRDIAIPGNADTTLAFCANQFVSLSAEAIAQRGLFTVALSGGSTPKALYALLSSPHYRDRVDWPQVMFFWSDERSVPPDNTESNYAMAMSAGLEKLPIKPKHIFRMPAESEDIEDAAKIYEKLIEDNVPEKSFDLIMLGMGEDGHTASLFPKTHGLHANGRLVIANYVPQKDTWRMTFTFSLINRARHTSIYVIGKSKAEMLKTVLTGPYMPDDLPIQRVGTPAHKALWITDTEAAALIENH